MSNNFTDVYGRSNSGRVVYDNHVIPNLTRVRCEQDDRVRRVGTEAQNEDRYITKSPHAVKGALLPVQQSVARVGKMTLSIFVAEALSCIRSSSIQVALEGFQFQIAIMRFQLPDLTTKINTNLSRVSFAWLVYTAEPGLKFTSIA